jgi:hypothetical protein
MQGKKVIEASGFGPLEGPNYGYPLSGYGPGEERPWGQATTRHSILWGVLMGE